MDEFNRSRFASAKFRQFLKFSAQTISVTGQIPDPSALENLSEDNATQSYSFMIAPQSHGTWRWHRGRVTVPDVSMQREDDCAWIAVGDHTLKARGGGGNAVAGIGKKCGKMRKMREKMRHKMRFC